MLRFLGFSDSELDIIEKEPFSGYFGNCASCPRITGQNAWKTIVGSAQKEKIQRTCDPNREKQQKVFFNKELLKLRVRFSQELVGGQVSTPNALLIGLFCLGKLDFATYPAKPPLPELIVHSCS